jgi:hypothetical protein
VKRLGFLLLLVAAIFFSSACGSDSDTSKQSIQSSDVHPCDPAAVDPFGVQASRLNSTPTSTPSSGTAATPGSSPVVGGTVVRAEAAAMPGCVGPDFSQRCPVWGGLEYDHGRSSNIGCGTSIAQCGCAMTAAASLLRYYGVDKSADGEPTNPKTLNDWFNQDTRATADGAVSRGYVYGGVNWLAVANYSKAASAKFGTPSVAYFGNLASDLTALRTELGNDRPVILEQPGHFILAKGDQANKVTISDPFYAERTALDAPAYKNSFVSGRLYRPGSDMSAVLVASPERVKVSISNPAGQTTGIKPGQSQPVTEVRQSQFAIEEAWQDPSCTVGAPLPGKGVAMSTLLLPSAAKYGVDVHGAPNTTYNFVVYAYDQAGGAVMHNFEGNLPASGAVRFQLDYNPAAGSRQPMAQVTDPLPPATPSPGQPVMPTPTAQPAPPTATTAPGATATPRPTNTAAPTATTAPTATVTPSPAAKIAMQVYQFELDCTDTTEITAVAFPTDANSRIPATTVIDFTTTRGTVVPPSPSTSIGRAEVKVYPGKNPDSSPVVITITARIRGTNISTSASVTCKTPIIIL